jgi:hypothetical protein
VPLEQTAEVTGANAQSFGQRVDTVSVERSV